jgi:ABC-type branched-subunit amino acid transport system substrate-binding protein
MTRDTSAAAGERAHRPVGEYRVGVLIDFPNRPGYTDMFPETIALAFEEAFEEGLIDRPVELVVREVVAQPFSDGFAVIDAYLELAENGKVLAICGPMSTDNALAVLPHVERTGVPTLSICGSQHFVGRAAFNLSNGGMADEPEIVCAWLRGRGHRRVAVLRDYPSQIGEEYSRYFRRAAASADIEVLLERGVSQLAGIDELTEAIRALERVEPAALVYWGIGGTLSLLFGDALARAGWDPPRIMSAAFVGASCSPERARAFDGWCGIDQWDERNPVFQELWSSWGRRRKQPPIVTSVGTIGYDAARALALAISRMPLATPEGVREGLETVRRMPAATGALGTVISFGPQDHRGFKGADYLLVRRSEAGRSVFDSTAPVA